MIQKPIRGIQLNKTHSLSKGLVGCWLFNEMIGETTFDLSGHGNNGTLENGVAWDGNGLEFDGVDDYVDVGSGSSLNSTQGSLNFWVKSTNDNASSIYSIVQDPSNFFSVAIGDGTTSYLNNEIITILRNVGGKNTRVGYITTTRTELFDGHWHNIVVTYNGSSYQLFLDGNEKSVTIGINNASGWSNELTSTSIRIATDAAFNWDLNGTIKYINTYNRALSAEEIVWSYREPYAMFDKPLSPALLYAATATGVANAGALMMAIV